MNVYYKVTPIDAVRYHTTALKGSVEYLRQRRAYRYYQAVWLLLWTYGVLVTLVYVRSVWALVAMAALMALQLRQLVPFETYMQRQLLERFGSAAVRERMLVMDDRGITEHESEVICYAPWSKVREAGIYRDLLILRLDSGQHIVIPRHSLSPGEWTLESILENVSSRLELSKVRNGADHQHHS